jgi:hypothetical protein
MGWERKWGEGGKEDRIRVRRVEAGREGGRLHVQDLIL